MFGWEFPPHIAGGLGTASYGLPKGLAKHGVTVLFVMPKAGGDADQSVVKIINASDVEMMSEYSTLDEYWQNVNFMEIGSNLVPYLDPETFVLGGVNVALLFLLAGNVVFLIYDYALTNVVAVYQRFLHPRLSRIFHAGRR